MNFSDLTVVFDTLISGNLIKEVRISLDSRNRFLRDYIHLSVQNEMLAEDFYDDFSTIPPAIRHFIHYFRNYQFNLILREGLDTLAVFTPLDHFFLENALNFNTTFIIQGKKKRLSYIDEPTGLKVYFDATEGKLTLTGKKGFLLRTNSGGLILEGERLRPLLSPFHYSLLEKLFHDGETEIDHEMKVRLLTGKRDYGERLSQFIDMPDVEDFTAHAIVMDFHAGDEYVLEAFITAIRRGIEYTHPLNFSDVRKSLLMNEEILIPFEQEKYLILHPETPFYENIRTVVNSVYNQFFEFLKEIQDNKIVTRDNENLFLKFLPKIHQLVRIRSREGELEFIKDQFSEKSIEFQEAEHLPTDTETEPYYHIDWLEINFRFKIRDMLLTLSELKEMLAEGYLLKDNRILTTEQEELDLLRELFNDGAIREEQEKGEKRLLVKRYNLPTFLRDGVNILLPGRLAELPGLLVSDHALQKVRPPASIEPTLRHYQKIGIYWLHFLHRFHFGGILADEMGLGKTLEILAFLKTIQGEGPSLIICPSSLVYNWVAEIEKFFPGELSYTVIDGNKERRNRRREKIARSDIAITSYHIAHLDVQEFGEQQFVYCILDEAQHIKNKAAKRTRSIKEIRSHNRIAITGTPLENNIVELWSIFDFLMPGFLGTHQWFKKNFETPITGFNRNERNIALKKLKQLINPFVLRRTKAVVYKELPPKIEQVVSVELSEKQKALYLDTLSRIRNHYFPIVEEKGLEHSYIEFLAALTRLRQICLHPGLVNPELLDDENALSEEDISAKLAVLIELVQEALDSGHRVLVFSQFVQMLKIMRREFHRQQIEYLYIDGNTKDRVGLVEHFNQSDIPVFLISLKAGGVGLNLVGADSVILFDPWWNPAVENQAVDRAHRIGQVNVVNVYRLVTRGTIEEKIQKLQVQKRHIFDAVMDKDDSFIRKMTWEDIRTLFEFEEDETAE